MRIKHQMLIACIVTLNLTSAQAENAINLNDYLSTMDKKLVYLEGGIAHKTAITESFVYYDKNREPFTVNMDAGRDVRERIQAECEVGLMVTISDLCQIKANASLEIRGSQIQLSIGEVIELSK